MKKYELSTIGTFHTNHNEDFLITEELGSDKFLLAVMDGCSMGKESHFAATLVGKLLRKIAKENSFKSFVEKTEKSLQEHLQQIIENLFEELVYFKNRLLLERDELLSTLLLGIFHPTNKEAVIITIGDGLVCYNGEYIEYEQDNRPDYLGYHLGISFENWFNQQTQILYLEDVKDLSLSTDGIFTFQAFDTKRYESIDEESLLDFLLIDKTEADKTTMLKKKLLEIEAQYGLKPTDDLSIIRIVNE